MIIVISLLIVTRNIIVWKIPRGYCLCYCKTFLLMLDSTECIKIFFVEVRSTVFVPPKIKLNYRSKENHQYRKTSLYMIDFV